MAGRNDDLGEFNARFADLYSENQQKSHTYNLNGIIYRHSHNGGPDIPVGRTENRIDENGRITTRQDEDAFFDAKRYERTDASKRKTKTAKPNQPARPGNQARSNQPVKSGNQVNPKQTIKPNVPRQGKKNLSAKKVAITITLVVLIFYVLVTVIATIGFNFATKQETETVKRTVIERESEALKEQIKDVNTMYVAGSYITLGMTLDTLLSEFELVNELEEPLEPGDTDYFILSKGNMDNVVSVSVTNKTNKTTKKFSDLTIHHISSDCYYNENYEAVETDAEIAYGITIGMNADEAVAAFSKFGEEIQEDDYEGRMYYSVYDETYTHGYNMRTENGRVVSLEIMSLED